MREKLINFLLVPFAALFGAGAGLFIHALARMIIGAVPQEVAAIIGGLWAGTRVIQYLWSRRPAAYLHGGK